MIILLLRTGTIIKSFCYRIMNIHNSEFYYPRLTFKELEPQHDVEDPALKDVSIIVEHQKKYNRMVTEVFQRNEIEFTPSQVL